MLMVCPNPKVRERIIFVTPCNGCLGSEKVARCSDSLQTIVIEWGTVHDSWLSALKEIFILWVASHSSYHTHFTNTSTYPHSHSFQDTPKGAHLRFVSWDSHFTSNLSPALSIRSRQKDHQPAAIIVTSTTEILRTLRYVMVFSSSARPLWIGWVVDSQLRDQARIHNVWLFWRLSVLP